jgi:acetyl-CoA acetyltransferase
VRLQHGDIDSALVYGFGKASLGSLPDVLVAQLDPYVLQPLWPDATSLAALQARAMIDAGKTTEAEMAAIARSRGRTDGADAYVASPLRERDCAPVTDGAAAIVLAAGDRARAACDRPAWIRGIDHRIEPHALGCRDLTSSASTRMAAERAGVASAPVDVAEIHAPFSHQEVILREALGLGERTTINPSGGALAANPMMAAGLIRIGEAAQRIMDGSATRAVAHATSGSCLQQNLVCVLEGD